MYNTHKHCILTDDKNMATNWWKIMVLQILTTAVIGSTGVELGDDSKLSNENMISLFKMFLEVK